MGSGVGTTPHTHTDTQTSPCLSGTEILVFCLPLPPKPSHRTHRAFFFFFKHFFLLTPIKLMTRKVCGLVSKILVKTKFQSPQQP